LKTSLAATLLSATLLSACDASEPSPHWGEVDPAFLTALDSYENWDRSCAPGDSAHEDGLLGGVALLKVDALECAHARLADAAPLSTPARAEKAKLAAALYGMTNDPVWNTTEYCDIAREKRQLMIYEVTDYRQLASNQSSSKRAILPKHYIDNIYAFFECADDYDRIDFHKK